MTKRTTTAASPTKKPKTPKKPARRTSWLDPTATTSLIDGYARQMKSFLNAMEDGVIERHEVKQQEKRLVSLMKKLEPQLDDEMHEQVTQLLCEATVYNMMQMLAQLHESRPKARFRG
jgi:hypothetical protein